MFGKKNEKLETLKDLIDSRAGYIETIQMLDLNKKEKDVFLRASLEVRKKKPNLEIIEQAYEILLDNSGANKESSEDDEHTHNDLNTSTQDNKILDFVKETIGESSKFMEHINKYDFSKNEKAVLSGAFSDLKKEKYDIDRIHSAYEIIRKYENGDISQPDESKNQETSLSFCSNCGTVLSENINFCSKCGTAVLAKSQKFNIDQNDSAKGTQKSIRTSSKLKSISKYGLILILVIAGLFLVYNSFFSIEYAYERQLYKKSGIIYKKIDNKPYTGVRRSNPSTDTGERKEETNFINGKKDGLSTKWYENGQKEIEKNYKNGKLEGVHIEWYRSGQKKSETNFKNNKLDGLAREWDEDGKKEKEANFKNGKLDGLATQWYENGQKRFESNLKNGKLNGLTTQWYKNGQKEIDKHYKNGKLEGLTRSWHKDGSVKAMEMYSNGILKKEW